MSKDIHEYSDIPQGSFMNYLNPYVPYNNLYRQQAKNCRTRELDFLSIKIKISQE